MGLLIVILLIVLPLTASAQKVVDAVSGDAIAGAVVQLLDEDYKPIDYSITNDKGGFKPFAKSGVWLKFSCMNYRADTIEVSRLSKIIKLKPEIYQLKEIMVVAPKIRQYGDTISYNVASFAGVTDRTIGDVLDKMPGIKVRERGQIEYNGIPINKFYIEGVDMMDSRYGVATNSISFSDVAAVEVMENHQPIKALDGVAFSDKAAINLNLKEDAKARWAGYIEVGGGLPKLYTGEVAAMSFGRKIQTINTLKANNTGKDIISQTSATSQMELVARQENGCEIADYITITPKRVPNVDTHLGNNESLSTNFLSKISTQSDIKGNITLSNSHFRYEQKRATTYFLQDSTTINIIEDERSRDHNRIASANFTFTTNSKDFYMRNTLKGEFGSSSIYLQTLGTYLNEQFGSIHAQDYSNNFEMIKRIRVNTLNISSYNGYASKPQELSVNDNFMQEISASVFSSHTKASYGFKTGNWNIFARAGVNYYDQSVNNSRFSYIKLYIAPRAEYRSRKGLVFTFDLPLNYYISQNSFMPSLNSYMKLPLSARWSLTANAGAAEGQIQNRYFYSDAIRNDYRTISYGISEFLSLKKGYGVLGFAYKDPLTLLFVNGSAQYSKNINPYILSQKFEGEYLINSFVETPSHNSAFSANFNIGKGYRGGRASIGLNYVLSNGESLQNGTKLKYRLNQLGVIVKTNKKFAKWLSLEYAGQFLMNILDNATNKSWFLNQSGRVIFSLAKEINIIAQGGYLLTENSELFLLGATAQWKINRCWELSIEATNLLDQSHYLVEHLSGTEFISTQYKVRSRSIFFYVKLNF